MRTSSIVEHDEAADVARARAEVAALQPHALVVGDWGFDAFAS